MRPPVWLALAVLVSCSRAQPAAIRVSAPPTQAPAPTPTGRPTPAPASPGTAPVVECAGEGCFDVNRAMTHDRALAVDIGPRPAGSDADRTAADYVRTQLEAAGLRAWLQPFALPQGGTSWNVIGVPEDAGAAPTTGSSPAPSRPYLLLGGHLDTVPAAPGGNDNASGISVVLDIVRAERVQPASLPVVVVAFGAEEVQPGRPRRHHVGSLAYVERMSEQARRNLVAMLNVDMVGRGPSLICGRLSAGPREATGRLLALASRLGVPAQERVTPDWSDNGPFLKAGLNAGWLWSGEDSAKHTPRDTFDRVETESVDRAGRLALAAVRSYP